MSEIIELSYKDNNFYGWENGQNAFTVANLTRALKKDADIPTLSMTYFKEIKELVPDRFPIEKFKENDILLIDCAFDDFRPGGGHHRTRAYIESKTNLKARLVSSETLKQWVYIGTGKLEIPTHWTKISENILRKGHNALRNYFELCLSNSAYHDMMTDREKKLYEKWKQKIIQP